MQRYYRTMEPPMQDQPPQSATGAALPNPSGKEPRRHHPTVKELEEQVAKLTDLAARAQADLQNFKMRMEREAAELRKFAVVPFLLKLLPIRDDIVRALQHQNENGNSASAHNGLKHILEKFDKVLKDAGVERMAAVGNPFDPKQHEILNSSPGAKDIVTAIHEEGYELHGKVLRPAKVQVGDGAGTPQTSQP